MSILRTTGEQRKLRNGFVIACGLAVGLAVSAEAAEPAAKDAKVGEEVSGRDIFMREWLPNDPRSHGGDGLGPVFNDSSCVACHNQGGPGGGGAASKNVNIVSATFNRPIQQMRRREPSVGTKLIRSIIGLPNTTPKKPRQPTEEDLKRQRDRLVEEVTKIHPGFRTAGSVVIHHFGNDENYENWKSNLLSSNEHFHFIESELVMTEASSSFGVEKEFGGREEPIENAVSTKKFSSSDLNRGRNRLHRVKSRVRPVVTSGANQHGHFAVAQSQRNATALFGAGLIDAVPDEVLIQAAKKTHEGFPEISGRVARLPDGKIGRYGWKAQKATLRDFTVTACAVELGLHVPEHPQSGDPNNAKYKPAGYDLTKKECDKLVEYIRDLPAPTMRKSEHPAEAKLLDEGKALFAGVGCATCHAEDLGPADDIYSDLLVHDLGPELGDTGSYGVFLPDSPGGDDGSPVPPITELTKPQGGSVFKLADDSKNADEKIVGTTNLEWRTPPLWGVRDSAPYLHDGRAKTLEEAIAMHGGEAQKSATYFFALSAEERQKVIFFMKSLEAPAPQVAER